jgi:cytochrome c biogenesis protein CcmG/thiol:disulfide interchange protein DsbE
MSLKLTKYITLVIIILLIFIGVVGAFYDRFSAPSNAVKIEATENSNIVQASENVFDKEAFAAATAIDRAFIDFQAPDLNGDLQAIKARGEGQSILHFWATWCAPCILELPALIRKAQDSDMRFVVISVDENLESVTRFKNRLIKANSDLNFKAENIIWLHDKDMKIMQELYGVQKLPESFLTDDASAKLTKHFAGPVDWKNEDL